MNDLLGDAGGDHDRHYEDEDVEAGLGQDEENDPHMKKFFADVEAVKNDMAEMRRKLRSVQECNEESKRVTRASQMKGLKQRMDGDINSALSTAKGIKDKLTNLQRENALSRKRPGCEEGTSTDRTRMSVTATQTKKLKDLMNEFQDLRSKVSADYKKTVERRYYTVTGEHADPDLVDQLIETGDSERIFQKAIQEQGRGQLMDAIAEIQERSDAVHDLEKQLHELHQIFMDMAVLVESQGELLDNVETQVGSARDHVAAGTKQLVEARRTQINTRKWIICGIITLIIIIIIIVIVVLKPWEMAT